MAIHSQLIGCSASEVAAMIEGVMRHGTTMEVDASYTDSHGQSEIGFGITRLLGFDLLPRIKRINKTRLYRPAAGTPAARPLTALGPLNAPLRDHPRSLRPPPDAGRPGTPGQHPGPASGARQPLTRSSGRD